MRRKLFSTVRQTFGNTRKVAGEGFGTMIRDPQITVYAYLAVIFIYATSPLVTRLVVNSWHRVEPHPHVAMAATAEAPHTLLTHLGLVAFPVFYTFFVTAYFTCAVSASVLAKLQHRQTSLFYGLRVVGQKFLRVTWFAILSVFFFPLGIIAQRHKLPRGIIGVLMGSFGMSMAQLAPAIIARDDGVFQTVNHALQTLGQASKESFVIRVGTIGTVLILGTLGFLPKIVQHYWFDGHTARFVGWLVSILLGVGIFVASKVLSTVITTTLYYKAAHKEL